jgi:hypothetical protein
MDRLRRITNNQAHDRPAAVANGHDLNHCP